MTPKPKISEKVRLRMEEAMNPNTPRARLLRLLKDPNPIVAELAAKNPVLNSGAANPKAPIAEDLKSKIKGLVDRAEISLKNDVLDNIHSNRDRE